MSCSARSRLARGYFNTPPGILAAAPSPGRPLGVAPPTPASVADDLGRGTPQPVSVPANSGNGAVTTCNFSNWNKPTDLTATPH